jgi:hypothetical protein
MRLNSGEIGGPGWSEVRWWHNSSFKINALSVLLLENLSFAKNSRMRISYKISIAVIVFFIGAIIGGVTGIILISILTVESNVSGFLEKAFIVVPICALIGGLGSLFVLGPIGQRE